MSFVELPYTFKRRMMRLSSKFFYAHNLILLLTFILSRCLPTRSKRKELKEAFRLYDKEGESAKEPSSIGGSLIINNDVIFPRLCSLLGNGYIPTSSLREILAALDDQLTNDQLNGKWKS
jgi:hypothetical protein